MRSSGNLKRIGTGKNSGWKGWPVKIEGPYSYLQRILEVVS
jgi:hypothetical protein